MSLILSAKKLRFVNLPKAVIQTQAEVQSVHQPRGGAPGLGGGKGGGAPGLGAMRAQWDHLSSHSFGIRLPVHLSALS